MEEQEARLARSCCFTGHRSSKLPWGGNEADARCLELKRKLADALEELYGQGVRHFICGMATGCDMFFAEAVLALRERRPDVTLEAAIPCEEQDRRWTHGLSERYDRLLAECDSRTLVSRAYTPECMMRRNRYMVDHSDLLIALHDGLPGGTRYTIEYAMRRGVNIIDVPIEE